MIKCLERLHCVPGLLMFSLAASALLYCVGAEYVRPQAPLPISQGVAADDPFLVPQGMFAFARGRAMLADGERGKAEALLKALVQPEELGGLGISYSNDRTRTISEVWVERKANCLSLTMAYVMLAKQLKIRALFAESFAAVNWSRIGGLILREKHMVAVVLRDTHGDLVADFLPATRPRFGSYFVDIITEGHARSLYYSNRAIEALMQGNGECATEQIAMALEADPASSQAWNILGVMEKSKKNIAGAIRSYRAAIAYNPKDVSAISNLALLYRAEGLFAESARLRAAEDRLRRGDPYYFAFLASEAMEGNDLKKAQKSIQRAIKLHPKDPDFYITLSHVYHAQGKMAEAIGALDKAMAHATPETLSDLELLIEEFKANLASR